MFVTLFVIAAPVLAQGKKRWTLVLEGRGICGMLTRDRNGSPFEFTTDRGVVVSIADYPSLTSKANLYPGCASASINSVEPDEPATEESLEREREAAKKAKADEQRDIDEWLDQYCERHPDEPGCKD